MTGSILIDLATRVTAAEREHRRPADQLWQGHDVLAAVRERGIADGLDEAQLLHREVVAEVRGNNGQADPLPIDGAMHSVWLHGKWRWLTSKMSTEQREAAADAVQRYSSWLNRQDRELSSEVLHLRWWRDA
jgi:hypothetical protein